MTKDKELRECRDAVTCASGYLQTAQRELLNAILDSDGFSIEGISASVPLMRKLLGSLIWELEGIKERVNEELAKLES